MHGVQLSDVAARVNNNARATYRAAPCTYRSRAAILAINTLISSSVAILGIYSYTQTEAPKSISLTIVGLATTNALASGITLIFECFQRSEQQVLPR